MKMKTDWLQDPITFRELYLRQIGFQELIGNTGIPKDDPDMLAHHLLGMVTEIGEVAQADKRWKKNKRNDHYDRDEKVKEMADVAVFLLNIIIYSGIDPDEMLKAINDKIKENSDRYKKSLIK